MKIDERTILVVGATGKQGGAVARHLMTNGWEVKAMTRDESKPEAKDMRKLGAQVIEADLEDLPSLIRALKGVYGVFGVMTPYENGVDGELRQGKNLVVAAKEDGIKHFVYSSVGGADRRTGIPHFESKWQIENILIRSRIPSTILRPVFLMENFSNPTNKAAIQSGRLESPLSPDRRLQMVATDDVGGFAAMAFDDPEHWFGKSIELAGDEMTMPEAAEMFSQAAGRPVKYNRTDLELIKSPDTRAMFDWFQREGYKADIPKLREMRPSLMTLDRWLGSAGWDKAAHGSDPMLTGN